MKYKPEEITQISVLNWLALQHPVISEHVVMIGNEGKRSIIGHRIAKRMGMHVGASDLFIAYPRQPYAGLWLEVKPDGWTKSKTNKVRLQNQWDFIHKMRDAGYWADMGVGFDHCIDIINRYIATKRH